MYIESIDLNFIQPCTTDSKRIRIMANISTNISDILPYLNAYIKTGMYNKKSKTFLFNKEDKIITIFEDRVNVAKLLNETDAFEILDYIKDIINEVHNEKDNIIPNEEIIKLPSPIEIYAKLPKLNCKMCGQQTCLAFAIKLVKCNIGLKKCLPLHDNFDKEKLQDLENMLKIIGYDVD